MGRGLIPGERGRPASPLVASFVAVMLAASVLVIVQMLADLVLLGVIVKAFAEAAPRRRHALGPRYGDAEE